MEANAWLIFLTGFLYLQQQVSGYVIDTCKKRIIYKLLIATTKIISSSIVCSSDLDCPSTTATYCWRFSQLRPVCAKGLCKCNSDYIYLTSNNGECVKRRFLKYRFHNLNIFSLSFIFQKLNI